MDPHENLREQREIAVNVISREDMEIDDPSYEQVVAELTRMAQLFLALEEWRCKGGFDPYSV